MAKAKPRHSDSGIVSPWLGASSDQLPAYDYRRVPINEGNQTSFYKELGYYSGRPGGAADVRVQPNFPVPQSIKNLPLQNAGYTDYARSDDMLWAPGSVDQNVGGRRINVAGKTATGVVIEKPWWAQDFFNSKKVYVNPVYKDKYDKIGNDPDSSDRSLKPQIVGEEKMDTLRAMGLGINEWAKATSKYFDKPVAVNKSPVPYKHGAPLTQRVDILGEDSRELWAGQVSNLYGSETLQPQKVLKSPGGENRVTKAGPNIKTMTLNTILSPQAGYYPLSWEYVTQHEFGHTMGIAHPHNYSKGTTLNSEMSYDQRRRFGSTILPATINAYKKQMNMNYGYTGLEELGKKLKAQKEAASKLQKLNQKYEKKKKYGY